MMSSTFRHLACWAIALCLAMPGPTFPAAQAQPASGDDKTIVFVCLHGVVNSQMAAAYFNKVAKERGLPFAAVSRGIDLYRSVPVRVRDGLALDGLEPANTPLELTAEDAAKASAVFAFDTIPAERKGTANVTYWFGVPIGIDDYEATRDEIARRIDAMIPTLASEKTK